MLPRHLSYWPRRGLSLRAAACGLTTIFTLALLDASPADGAPPATKRRLVTQEYHGQKVKEDYAWLEDANNPAVSEWTSNQNTFARSWLDRAEARPLVEMRLREIYAKTSATYSDLTPRGSRLFFYKSSPPAQQPVLMILTGTNNPALAKVVLDPNKLGKNGDTTIDWFVPSLDGRTVAVSLSANGSELGALHFYEADTGQELGDVVPRVHGPTAGGSAVWKRRRPGVLHALSGPRRATGAGPVVFSAGLLSQAGGTPGPGSV